MSLVQAADIELLLLNLAQFSLAIENAVPDPGALQYGASHRQ